MAFQMNGTNIINDSSNLVNVANRGSFVQTGLSNLAAGAVGTYALLGDNSSVPNSLAHGATRSGSLLKPGCVTGTNGTTTDSDLNENSLYFRSSTLSGTWVAVDERFFSSSDTKYLMLWIRIS